jgi:hypothetical protein
MMVVGLSHPFLEVRPLLGTRRREFPCLPGIVSLLVSPIDLKGCLLCIKRISYVSRGLFGFGGAGFEL